MRAPAFSMFYLLKFYSQMVGPGLYMEQLDIFIVITEAPNINTDRFFLGAPGQK